MSKFSQLKIGTKLVILVVVFLLGFGLFGLFSFMSLKRVKINGPIYVHIAQNQEVIQDILPPPLNIVQSRLNALQMMDAAEAHADQATMATLAARAAKLRKEYEERYAYWMKEFPEGAVKRTLKQSYLPAMRFYKARDEEFIPAILAGAVDKAKAIDSAILQPEYEAHKALIDRTVLLAKEHAKRDEKNAAETVARAVRWLLAIGFGTAAISLLFSVLIARSITAPLAAISGVALDMAEGKLDHAPLSGITSRNEIGALAQAFNRMTAQLSEYIGKLRASEMKYRIVADNTYDWEFWRSQEGEYLYTSPSCERVSGYKAAEFAADQTLLLRLLPPEDRELFDEHQRLTLRPDCPPVSQIEYRLIAPDGSVRWISHVCSPVFDEEGRFLGKRGTNRDVTEQKKAEAALLEAKEQAESANRAKSAFISSMSHELRTPLNTIMGYTQILLRDENLNVSQRNQLEVMRKSGDHLLALINDILDVGKIESGKMELEETSFDLPSLLRQVVTVGSRKAEEKGLHFEYLPAGAVPALVRGDAAKIRQVLDSLLDNAVRYTREGGVTFRAAYEGETFRCAVADTGIGIPSESREAIFEPFTQLGREGQVSEGTGLGLAIARRVVTLMRGTLEVESEPGKGSIFRVEVPLATASAGEQAVSTAPPPAVQAAGAPAGEEVEVPPAERLRELSDLALLGDMRKIRAWADDIAESDSRYRRFGEEVRELAEAYKAKAISALVERHLLKKG